MYYVCLNEKKGPGYYVCERINGNIEMKKFQSFEIAEFEAKQHLAHNANLVSYEVKKFKD